MSGATQAASSAIGGQYLDAERALSRRRRRLLGSERRLDSRFETEANQPRSGENDRVVLPFVELAQAGIEIAAQRFDLELRISGAQEYLAPQLEGADHGASSAFESSS